MVRFNLPSVGGSNAFRRSRAWIEPAPNAPARGQWRDAHFSKGAADLLDRRVPVEQASTLAQGLQMRLPRDSLMSAKMDDYIQSLGLDQQTAERILQIEHGGTVPTPI